MKTSAIHVAAIFAAFLSFAAAQKSDDQKSKSTTREESVPAVRFASLIGKWYVGGDANRVCYIAAAAGKLFAINDTNVAAELAISGDNSLIAKWPGSPNSAIVMPKYILWSVNQWWSREPANFSAAFFTKGKWEAQFPEGASSLVFRKDGSVLELWRGEPLPGRWKDGPEAQSLVLERADGSAFTFKMTDKDSCVRNDGTVYTRTSSPSSAKAVTKARGE
ncbi:MAG: hypothetical protein ACREKL_00185 [Chthoniobacterales bacterium]